MISTLRFLALVATVLLHNACTAQTPPPVGCCARADSLAQVLAKVQAANDSLTTLLVAHPSTSIPKGMLKLLDKPVLQQIAAADSVVLYYLDPFAPDSSPQGLNGYKVLKKVTATPLQQQALHNLLLTPASYVPDIMSMCLFAPQIGMVFYRMGKDPVQVLSCFTCDSWEFGGAGSKKTIMFSVPARNQLLSIMSLSFPEIQQIKRIKP